MNRVINLLTLGPRLAFAVTAEVIRHVPGLGNPPDEEPWEAPVPSTTVGTRKPEADAEDTGEEPQVEQESELKEPRNLVPQEVGGGFPEPPGRDPGDRSHDADPHHALNTPVGEADPTEWPDPYEQREDPRDPPDPDGRPFGDEPHAPVGATSTSEPHPDADIAAPGANAPHRDKLDD